MTHKEKNAARFGIGIIFLGLSILSVVLFCCGCASPQGIPNWAMVDARKNIMRGGQPGKVGWDSLKAAGITNVIKLNSGHGDDYAKSIGMTVHYIPISTCQQIFGGKSLAVELESAERFIGPGTLVHCKNGWDRTGLTVGIYRIEHGWNKTDAEKEMLDMGFHKSLLGLYSNWESAK